MPAGKGRERQQATLPPSSLSALAIRAGTPAVTSLCSSFPTAPRRFDKGTGTTHALTLLGLRNDSRGRIEFSEQQLTPTRWGEGKVILNEAVVL